MSFVTPNKVFSVISIKKIQGSFGRSCDLSMPVTALFHLSLMGIQLPVPTQTKPISSTLPSPPILTAQFQSSPHLIFQLPILTPVRLTSYVLKRKSMSYCAPWIPPPAMGMMASQLQCLRLLPKALLLWSLKCLIFPLSWGKFPMNGRLLASPPFQSLLLGIKQETTVQSLYSLS